MWPNLAYFPVNWTDGMRISSKDFTALENSLYDQISDVRRMQLNEFCYGLLPTSNLEIDRYPKFKYTSSQSLITLLECRAITPGGHRIEIVENLHEASNIPEQLPSIQTLSHYNGIFEVFIKVNPFERVGAGRFSDDVPPRYKSVAPRYELSLRPKTDNRLTSTEDILKISEIELNEGRLSVVLSESGEYIPPCLSVASHSRLLDVHQKFGQILENILRLIKSIREKNLRFKDTSGDVKDVLVLSERIAMTYIGYLDYYNTILLTVPPANMVVFFKGLARNISFLLETHIFIGLEVKKVFDRNMYDGKFKALIDVPIEHAHIHPSLEAVYDYLEVIETCFSELNNMRFREVIISVVDMGAGKVPMKEATTDYKAPPIISEQKEKSTRRF